MKICKILRCHRYGCDIKRQQFASGTRVSQKARIIIIFIAFKISLAIFET